MSSIMLPNPIDCDCKKGKLVPLLGEFPKYGMGGCIMCILKEISWKCSVCGKHIKPE